MILNNDDRQSNHSLERFLHFKMETTTIKQTKIIFNIVQFSSLFFFNSYPDQKIYCSTSKVVWYKVETSEHLRNGTIRFKSSHNDASLHFANSRDQTLWMLMCSFGWVHRSSITTITLAYSLSILAPIS